MTENVRGYPNISFVDTDTETLVNALIRSYERFTGRTLYPADPTRLFLLWIADIIIQERVNIDFSAKQNLPRYAEGEYLDSLAEIFKDTYRLEPEAARTTIRFTLSMKLDAATIIPAGTRVTAGEEIIFSTLDVLTIPAGELTGDIAAECLTVGEIGNGFVPGQISKLVDIFPYFERVENITESAGGADRESDAAFYERMRESMETFSTAGPLGAYEYYAKTASAAIADAKAIGPEEEPGVVDIRILMQGGELPTQEDLNRVLETLTAERVRPLTDLVRVGAPEIVPFDIDLTYYIPKPNASGAAKISQDVESAVEKYKRWQMERMGRDINPSHLISLVMAAGAKRVDVRSPVFTVVEESAVAQVKKIAVLNGGIENE